MKKLHQILFFISLSTSLWSQSTDWYANFYNIMDNREYDQSIGNPQSIMGARIDVAAGLKQDSVSGLYLGVNYMYEYGGDLDSITPTLNLYYEIERQDFAFYAGSFPKNKLQSFPKFMFSDSLNYYTPNMGGMAFDFRRKWGNMCVFVDWTGRQSPTKRESFVAGFCGTYQRNAFYIEKFGYMYHYALRSGDNPDEHIEDNGVGAIYFGADLSGETVLDIFKCNVGMVGNYDRIRPGDINYYGGVMGRINAHYKRFGIDVTSYWGDKLTALLGDQLYRNGNYTRTDLCFVPIKGKKLESVFKWSFHFTGGMVSSSQQFFLVAKF